MPESELKCYHVKFEDRSFSESNGEKTSRPSLQKFSIREWGDNPSVAQWDYFERLRTGSDGRFIYEVLFDPREEAEMKTKDSDPVEVENAEPKAKKPKRGKINIDSQAEESEEETKE